MRNVRALEVSVLMRRPRLCLTSAGKQQQSQQLTELIPQSVCVCVSVCACNLTNFALKPFYSTFAKLRALVSVLSNSFMNTQPQAYAHTHTDAHSQIKSQLARLMLKAFNAAVVG